MKLSLLFLATALLATMNLALAERKHWALLIAGSAGYGNYRHQADVCHAYQILHKNGIPDEQIVVMMYDDIANNAENPYPGNIINKPGGPNVYPGVPKDYTKDEVNAETFLAVLKGDKEKVKNLIGREGKVIDSGPDDYVFVNFADHGGVGILGMPSPPYLKAKDLNDTLKEMYDQKKFAKLVFYLEACESGSMFNTLPKNINIYTTTAASPDESSYGCYCENDRNTCLGDLYSVNWMENSDSADLHTETLEKQFEIVKQETNLSHVQQYGDLTYTSLPVEQFLANKKARSLRYVKELRPTAVRDTVRTDMVGIHTLQSMLASSHPRHVARKTEIMRDLQAQLWIRSQTSQVFSDIVHGVYTGKDALRVSETRSEVRNWKCYESTMDRLFELCPRIAPHVNDFVLRKMYILVNLCNNQMERETISAIENAITSNPLCY
ncbi:legumain [Plakobranchus ocellatus]|uniref:Hemoglobinase n=1 Tax=Plakobranchus ocellatus TaxID=259542 RepID=A0AAV3ZVW7_9GAST|nr:legumain [Plakobranchus ocellatus]